MTPARRDVLKLAAIAELRGFGLVAFYGLDGGRDVTRHVEELWAVRGADGRWTVTLDPELGAELDVVVAGERSRPAD